MNILITGSKGYLGSLIVKELKSHHQVTGLCKDNSMNEEINYCVDITNLSRLKQVCSIFKPDVIIHTAAISSVNMAREDPQKTHDINVKGTENIVHVANEIGSSVIFISSLAVLGELDTYSQSKLEAEKCVHKVIAGYEILRLSMTYGLSPNTINKRPFNKILNCYLKNEATTFDDSWSFQPTYTKHFLFILNKLLKRPFSGRCISVTTLEKSTMFKIASDILSSGLVIASNDKSSRVHQPIIESKHLLDLGFPNCSYGQMINGIQEQLLLFKDKKNNQ